MTTWPATLAALPFDSLKSYAPIVQAAVDKALLAEKARTKAQAMLDAEESAEQARKEAETKAKLAEISQAEKAGSASFCAMVRASKRIARMVRFPLLPVQQTTPSIASLR